MLSCPGARELQVAALAPAWSSAGVVGWGLAGEAEGCRGAGVAGVPRFPGCQGCRGGLPAAAQEAGSMRLHRKTGSQVWTLEVWKQGEGRQHTGM